MLKAEQAIGVLHVGDASFYVIEEITEGLYMAVPQSTEEWTETEYGQTRVFALPRKVAVYGNFYVEYLQKPYPILCTDYGTEAEAE